MATSLSALNLSANQILRLRSAVADTGDLRVWRRATALLALHDGISPRQVAKWLGTSRQTVYNWISAYAGGGDELSLADSPRSGRPSLWTAELQDFIQRTVAQPPAHFGYPSMRWTAKTLQAHLASTRATQISIEALRRYLRTLGYASKTAGCGQALEGVAA